MFLIVWSVSCLFNCCLAGCLKYQRRGEREGNILPICWEVDHQLDTQTRCLKQEQETITFNGSWRASFLALTTDSDYRQLKVGPIYKCKQHVTVGPLLMSACQYMNSLFSRSNICRDGGGLGGEKERGLVRNHVIILSGVIKAFSRQTSF